jgi:hypothetical protein
LFFIADCPNAASAPESSHVLPANPCGSTHVWQNATGSTKRSPTIDGSRVKQTTEAVDRMIVDLEAKKLALHPEK